MANRKLTIVLCVVFVAIDLAKSEHQKFEECKKTSEKYFKRIHKVSMDCHAENKDPNASLEQQFEKIGCTVKCILKKDNMLDDKEAVTDDIINNAYKDRVIPEFEQKLLSHFKECQTKYGGKLDKTDPACKSYKEYGLCMQESISHVCYEQP